LEGTLVVGGQGGDILRHNERNCR